MANETNLKGLPDGSKENDIRHAKQARKLKSMPMMSPEEWEHDHHGYRCPVCDTDLEMGADGDFDPDRRPDPDRDGDFDPDTYVGGVGYYHVAHLSKEEYDYTRRIEQREEAAFDAALHREKKRKLSRAMAGDAAGEYGFPPDLPAESAMYGLEHDIDETEDELR